MLTRRTASAGLASSALLTVTPSLRYGSTVVELPPRTGKPLIQTLQAAIHPRISSIITGPVHPRRWYQINPSGDRTAPTGDTSAVTTLAGTRRRAAVRNQTPRLAAAFPRADICAQTGQDFVVVPANPSRCFTVNGT
jgi:hypothetical protein